MKGPHAVNKNAKNIVVWLIMASIVTIVMWRLINPDDSVKNDPKTSEFYQLIENGDAGSFLRKLR